MYISLRCSHCGDCAPVSFAQLYDLWKQGYDNMEAEHRHEAKVKTDVQCHCGTKDTYDSPMFGYVFQLVFDELIRKD